MSLSDLERFSDRALSMIASAIHGAPVTVVRSSRCRAPAALAMEGRALFLDLKRLGLYDLLVLAGLFRHRRECSPLHGAPKASAEQVACWLKAENGEVLRRFPRAETLEGRYRQGPLAPNSAESTGMDRESLPEVAWADVTTAPLDTDRLGLAGLAALGVKGVRTTSADDDLTRLAEAIVQGKLPVHAHPAVPALPYAEVQVRLETPAAPDEKTPEEAALERRIDAGARGIATCMQENLQGLQEERVRLRRSFGSRMDPSRLHDALVARKTGQPARVFRRRPVETDAVFRPDRHLAVLGFDVHSLHAAANRHGRVSLNLIRMLVRVYEMLEIECVVVTFRDQVLTLPDGRSVYLHMPHVAKALDEPFGPKVWSRLEAAWAPRTETGAAACLVPLQLATLERHARSAIQENQPRYLRFDYYTAEGLPAPHEDHTTQRRLCDATERVLKRVRDETAPEVALGVFLPSALIRHATGTIVGGLSDLGI